VVVDGRRNGMYIFYSALGCFIFDYDVASMMRCILRLDTEIDITPLIHLKRQQHIWSTTNYDLCSR
jgi:hypothetical protein